MSKWVGNKVAAINAIDMIKQLQRATAENKFAYFTFSKTGEDKTIYLVTNLTLEFFQPEFFFGINNIKKWNKVGS